MEGANRYEERKVVVARMMILVTKKTKGKLGFLRMIMMTLLFLKVELGFLVTKEEW